MTASVDGVRAGDVAAALAAVEISVSTTVPEHNRSFVYGDVESRTK